MKSQENLKVKNYPYPKNLFFYIFFCCCCSVSLVLIIVIRVMYEGSNILSDLAFILGATLVPLLGLGSVTSLHERPHCSSVSVKCKCR